MVLCDSAKEGYAFPEFNVDFTSTKTQYYIFFSNAVFSDESNWAYCTQKWKFYISPINFFCFTPKLCPKSVWQYNRPNIYTSNLNEKEKKVSNPLPCHRLTQGAKRLHN